MADEQKKELYGFSMPDGNSWVGFWDENEPSVLERVVVFETYNIRMESADEKNPYKNTSRYLEEDRYLTMCYLALELYRKTIDRKQPLPTPKKFNPDLAIARWYLHDIYEEARKGGKDK